MRPPWRRPGPTGTALSRGYDGPGSDEANAELIREDGWFMLGDVVTLEDDVLTVVGPIQRLDAFAEYIGDIERDISETHMLPFAFGIAAASVRLQLEIFATRRRFVRASDTL